MTYHYAILGSGRQGTAAAYDLAVHGDAASILLADLHPEQAQAAAARVNRLARRGHSLCGHGRRAQRPRRRRRGRAAARPPHRRLHLRRALLLQPGPGPRRRPRRGQHGRLRRQHRADPRPTGPRRRRQRRRHHPDARLRPGSRTGQLALRLHHEPVRRVPRPDHVRRRHPRRAAAAVALHPDLQHRGIDQRVLRARRPSSATASWSRWVASSRRSTSWWISARRLACWRRSPPPAAPAPCPGRGPGKLRTLQNKTIRWPGHFAQWKAFSDAGLIDLEPVEVDGQKVVPRHMLHALLGPRLYAQPGEHDLVIVRIIGRGLVGGQEREVVVDLFDRVRPGDGLSRRWSAPPGWHAAIICAAQARGQTPRGGVPVELAHARPGLCRRVWKSAGLIYA
jgi:hypothetical protein